MRNRRPRRLVPALLAVLVAVGLSSCGVDTTQASAGILPPGWAGEAARALQRGSTEGEVLGRSLSRVDAPLGAPSADFERLLRTAPPADPEVLQFMAELRARQWATGVVQETWNDVATTNGAVATTATASSPDTRVQDALKDIGTDVAKDLTCSAALDALSPQEDDEAKTAGTATWESIGQPTAQAVANYTAKRLAPWATHYVNWSTWGAGVLKDSEKLRGAATNAVRNPDSPYSSTFYAYVALCQIPSGR